MHGCAAVCVCVVCAHAYPDSGKAFSLVNMTAYKHINPHLLAHQQAYVLPAPFRNKQKTQKIKHSHPWLLGALGSLLDNNVATYSVSRSVCVCLYLPI